MISTQDLARVTRFCSSTSKSAPSPPLRQGEVYCLLSFRGRAEQWYKEEVGRQVALRCREASSLGTRRQPSRTAKDKFHVCDYVLSGAEVDVLLRSREGDKGGGNKRRYSESALLTPPGDNEAQVDLPSWDLEGSVERFRKRLNKVVQGRTRELRGRYDPEGIRHLCTVADMSWDCLDEEYCGHGLVDICLRWVPKKLELLRPRIRVDMEDFFSASTANNQPERLKELKKNRCSLLKKATLEKLAALELVAGSCPEAVIEAKMLESPTLGRWPNTPGFLREDVQVQKVGFAGLTFAVDVCVGEPRIMML